MKIKKLTPEEIIEDFNKWVVDRCIEDLIEIYQLSIENELCQPIDWEKMLIAALSNVESIAKDNTQIQKSLEETLMKYEIKEFLTRKRFNGDS